MTLTRGNLSLVTAAKNGKQIHLFQTTLPAGTVEYLGRVQYLKHQESLGLDGTGTLRKVLTFTLAVDRSDEKGALSSREIPDPPLQPTGDKESLRSLRQSLLSVTVAPPTFEEVLTLRAERSSKVRLYALLRANGLCEGCRAPAPFISRSELPYLEVHHIRSLSDEGPDHPLWVVALCPNCHRRVHHGKDGNEYNNQLKKRVDAIESNISSTFLS